MTAKPPKPPKIDKSTPPPVAPPKREKPPVRKERWDSDRWDGKPSDNRFGKPLEDSKNE